MTSRNKCTFLVFILVTTWEDVWHNEGYMYSIHIICFLLTCVVQTVLTVIVLRRQQRCILLITVNVNTATMLTFHLCPWAIKCLPAFQPCSRPPVWRFFFFPNGAKLTLEYARSCTRGSASLSPFKDGPPSKRGYVRCKNSLQLITPARNRRLTSVWSGRAAGELHECFSTHTLPVLSHRSYRTLQFFLLCCFRSNDESDWSCSSQ